LVALSAVAALVMQSVLALCCGTVAHAASADQAGHHADCPSLAPAEVAAQPGDTANPSAAAADQIDQFCQHAGSALCADAVAAPPAAQSNAGPASTDIGQGDPALPGAAWARLAGPWTPSSGNRHLSVPGGLASSHLLLITQRLRL
jgi:hypothetical protein